MFCYQCEQTLKGSGCTQRGICGKDPDTAVLQDLLIYATKGISQYAHRARKLGESSRDIDVFTIEALFSTITNVNFDPERVKDLIMVAYDKLDKARAMYENACKKARVEPEDLDGPARWRPESSMQGLIRQGEDIGIDKRKKALGDDITGLEELLTYGLKGVAAYLDHAQILGKEDDKAYAFIHEALDFIAGDGLTIDDLVGMCLRCGEVNIKAMELLDSANTGTYGDPVPTKVRIEPVKGKAILVSGHDLKDLEEILKQTQGKGINVYTHGEMLPAHGYPGLKKYPHLVGNYGGAWQDQRREFDRFPGAILMTTNCIQRPKKTYMDRIFTSGLVAWPGVLHIKNHDFSPVIDAALKAEGFKEDGPEKYITVGFGHEAVLSVAPKIIDLVK
ncbi:MAG TPA: hydroxylamine reductase, partial [Deltaproteobacteria bacterium]|nr:hydroxylamine reductase [Deltaproteobacteria bacterium]